MSPAQVHRSLWGAWSMLDEVAETRVVQRLTDNACGPACGQMLLRGAGTEVFQKTTWRMRLVASSPRLGLWPRRWTPLRGVTDASGPGAIERVALQAAAQISPFAQPCYWQTGDRIGHSVVVDAIDNG